MNIDTSTSLSNSMSLSEINTLKCHETINNLFEKYSDNNYILNKINNYITNLLPIYLNNDLNNYNKKQERYDKLVEIL